jgi:hypothetical protein
MTFTQISNFSDELTVEDYMYMYKKESLDVEVA